MHWMYMQVVRKSAQQGMNFIHNPDQLRQNIQHQVETVVHQADAVIHHPSSPRRESR